MTTKLDHALALAAEGFHVFPCLPWPMGRTTASGEVKSKGKHPAVKFKAWATRDPAAITAHWTRHPDCNIGIYTSKFGDDAALVCVDVDNKGTKRGDSVLFNLELEGFDFPDTREVATPTGGRHLYFRVPAPLKQGANVLGKGVDIRSRGGFVLGPGSTIDGAEYRLSGNQPVAPAPEWLVGRCGVPNRRDDQHETAPEIQVDAGRAVSRAAEYLNSNAPLAVEGDAGDTTAYRVAARIKDFGVDQATALQLLLEHWNPRCTPPWAQDELAEKVRNAYAYGLEAPGASTPEAQFTAVAAPPPKPAPSKQQGEINDGEHWVANMNLLYAVTNHGGRTAVNETVYDHDLGYARHAWVDFEDLKKRHLPQKVRVVKFNGKVDEQDIGTAWLNHIDRRQYTGEAFFANEPCPPEVLNLWRGFAVPPAAGSWAKMHDHLARNICGGDPVLLNYLLCWMARLVQHPGEAGQVAIVLRGEEGAGKGTVAKALLQMLGEHGIHITQPKHLTGSFNAHLQAKVFVFADEALFAGNPEHRGPLYALITEERIQLEPKGVDSRTARNVAHVLMATNSEWAVPAGASARRFCVLDVAGNNIQDSKFFDPIRAELKAGGVAAMLHDLLAMDLRSFNVFDIPKTKALLDQKISSLPLVQKWWLQCLEEGRLVNSDFGADWPGDVPRDRLRESIARYAKDLGQTRYLPDAGKVGKELKRCCPDLGEGRKANGVYTYKLPTLTEARLSWDVFLGQGVEWGE